MRTFANNLFCFALGCLCLGAFSLVAEGNPGAATTIRKISLLPGSTLELEIAATAPIKPQARVIQSPDRIVLDFPGTLPAKGLHNLEINRSDVVDARVGLFSSNPPVTRIVLDLKSAQPYQMFPYGNTVVVKFSAAVALPVNQALANRIEAAPDPGSDASSQTIISIERTPLANTSARVMPPSQETHTADSAAVVPMLAEAPRVLVTFQNGMLSIRSTKASLAEVLSEVHRRTGAEIAIPPGAEAEQVFTSLGPGAPKEVLASLLNGSHFNFIVMGSERDPGGIRRVVLTPKEGGMQQAVVYPCGSSQPGLTQASPDPQPPVQAFGTPMPPQEQSDAGDPQAQQPPPPPSQ